MHIVFSEDELRWINTKTLGWPVKKDCPNKILKSILKKKALLEKQEEIDNNGRTSGSKVER